MPELPRRNLTPAWHCRVLACRSRKGAPPRSFLSRERHRQVHFLSHARSVRTSPTIIYLSTAPRLSGMLRRQGLNRRSWLIKIGRGSCLDCEDEG